MDGEPRGDEGSVSRTTVRIPDHIVYRMFAAQAVVLNLHTGKYHGLNPSGGRMLEVLQEVADVEQAAALLATEYGRPAAEIERDLREFCQDLATRKLIEIDERPGD